MPFFLDDNFAISSSHLFDDSDEEVRRKPASDKTDDLRPSARMLMISMSQMQEREREREEGRRKEKR